MSVTWRPLGPRASGAVAGVDAAAVLAPVLGTVQGPISVGIQLLEGAALVGRHGSTHAAGEGDLGVVRVREEAELLTDLVASGAFIQNFMRDRVNIEEVFRR